MVCARVGLGITNTCFVCPAAPAHTSEAMPRESSYSPLPPPAAPPPPTCVTMPSECPRGMMVALCMGLAPGTLRATMAWPASCVAVCLQGEQGG